MAASFGGFNKSCGFMVNRPQERRTQRLGRAVPANGERAASQGGECYHPSNIAKISARVVAPTMFLAVGGSAATAVVYGVKHYMTDIAAKEDEPHAKKLENFGRDLQDIKLDVRLMLEKMTYWETHGGISQKPEAS